MKIKAADKWFSRVVREAAGWRCEACGKQYEEASQGLHCSHFWSRRHRATRWRLKNAAAHCYSCHQRLGGDPVEFALWVEDYLGAEESQRIRELVAQPAKVTKQEEKEIAAYYRREWARLREMRETQPTGRLAAKCYFEG